MFGKKKKNVIDDRNTNNSQEKYTMKESYNADELFLARFKWVSSEVTDFGPMDKETEIKYIFEKVEEKYKEVFTGFEADVVSEYFNYPYVVDIVPLTEVHEEFKGIKFPRLGMLLLFNDVNKKEMQEERGYQKKLESDNK
ncbi:MAG TPA: hypothetical protein IAB38_02520 [Candidatus Onthousia excrementipullorum]|uniref:Uncharacterized protein n=1 Tax=Candidatus Onthousia excrementipullorum TaxID=2840884 RepID=A0A9D1DTU8_9FIRM|nr:hypothetical protein [Candidatus Onthousia excrementipullorum]